MIIQAGQIAFATVTDCAEGDGLLLCFLPLHTCGASSSPGALLLIMLEFEPGLLGDERYVRTKGSTALCLLRESHLFYMDREDHVRGTHS